MNRALLILISTTLLVLNACDSDSTHVTVEADKRLSTLNNRQDPQQKVNTITFSEPQPLIRKITSNLNYLQDLTPQQISNLAGFSNQQLLILEPNTGSVNSYGLQERIPKLLVGEIAPQNKAVACQEFNSELINWFPLPTKSTGELSKSINHKKIVSALCGNINAELTPEIFLLTKAAEQLELFSVSPSKLYEINSWKKITSLKAEVDGKYYLLPDFSHHSAKTLQIVQRKLNKWQQVKTLYPRDFIEPFEYQPEDHNQIWMAYLNLDRASAKLMWHAGAKSIGELSQYLDSVNPGLTNNIHSQRDKIENLLRHLDPNHNSQVSLRLTDTFIRWKVPAT